MYRADKSFMRSLKCLDQRLDCSFQWSLERFVITYDRGYGEPLPLTVIETEDQQFRRPRQSDVEFLQRWDLENMRLKDRLSMVTKYMQDYRDQCRRRSRENFRDMTKDDKIQLMNVFGRAMGASKCNSAFRRITPKPKTEAFKVTDKRFHATLGNLSA